MSNIDRSAELEELHRQVRRCRKCFLWKTRKKAVPGEGPIDARVMLIGEGPGREEDETGRPFIGPSGKFLDEMFSDAGIARGELFITSTVKCIPIPAGKPRRVSIEACNPYLREQLRLIHPRVVCLFGEVAAKTVLGVGRIAEARGKPLTRDNTLFIVTYHPAAARRFPKLRDFMRQDLRLLREMMGSCLHNSHLDSSHR